MGHPVINEGKTCTRADCSNEVWSRELCRAHYYRVHRLKRKPGISIEAAVQQIKSFTDAPSTTDSLPALGVDPSTYRLGRDQMVAVIPFFGRLSLPAF